MKRSLSSPWVHLFATLLAAGCAPGGASSASRGRDGVGGALASNPGDPPPPNPNGASVIVDLAADQGPALQAANGMLVSVNPTLPADDRIAPLHPSTHRDTYHFTLGNYDRLRRMGVRTFQVALGFVFHDDNAGTYDFDTMGANGNYDDWVAFVSGAVRDFQARGMDVEYDIYNEPDLAGVPLPSNDKLYDGWRLAYQTIKSMDPNAKIVGPSVSDYRALKDFLVRAQAMNALPDIVSFHQYGDPTAAQPTLDDLRAFMAQHGMGDRPISVNEIIGAGYFLQPGYVAGTLAAYDRAGVESADHACWNDPHDGTADQHLNDCDNPSLDGLLDVDAASPRAGWYVYEAYARVTGRRVAVNSSNDRIAGLAAADAGQGAVGVLLGKYGDDGGGATLLTIAHLSQAPYLAGSGSVHVRAERIADTGAAPVGGTAVTIDTDVAVSGDAIQVTLPSFSYSDAYYVRLTAGSGGGGGNGGGDNGGGDDGGGDDGGSGGAWTGPNGKAVEVGGNGWATLYTPSGAPADNQRWSRRDDGTIRVSDDQCLTLTSSYDGAVLAARPCDGGDAQRWSSPGDGTIRSPDGRCVSISYADPSDGRELVIWPCTGHFTQTSWSIQK